LPPSRESEQASWWLSYQVIKGHAIPTAVCLLLPWSPARCRYSCSSTRGKEGLSNLSMASKHRSGNVLYTGACKQSSMLFQASIYASIFQEFSSFRFSHLPCMLHDPDHLIPVTEFKNNYLNFYWNFQLIPLCSANHCDQYSHVHFKRTLKYLARDRGRRP
jgi:hypothetical protein